MAKWLPDARREWLLDELARLLRLRGPDPFLRRPIIEPTDAFYPDSWQADRASVRRLVRRTLDYAGLENLGLDLETFEGDHRIAELSSTFGQVIQSAHRDSDTTVAWFAGISDERCLFGIEERHLTQSQLVPGVVAHEVAHAYRARYQLEALDHHDEELYTDLTTVYLGFGILTTNDSYRFRTGSAIVDGRSGGSFATAQRLGYLTPHEFAFLLGTQLAVRNIRGRALRQVLTMVEATQRRFVKLTHKEATPGQLAKRLGLTPDNLAAAAGTAGADRFNLGEIAFRRPTYSIRGRRFRCSGDHCNGIVFAEDVACARCGARLCGTLKRGESAEDAERRYVEKHIRDSPIQVPMSLMRSSKNDPT